MALELPTGTYGTLKDLAEILDRTHGSLRVARHRNPDDFPESCGTVAGQPVFRLEDIALFLARHKPGRPAANQRLSERMRQARG